MKKIISAFIKIIYSLLVFTAGALFVAKKAVPYITAKQKAMERFSRMFSLMDEWMAKKQQGKSIARFLEGRGYHSIAIYGMSNLGERLLKDLEEDNLNVSYGIDRREISAATPMYKLEDDLPEVDAVIVTAMVAFDGIEEKLKKKMDCPIYSIEDAVYFME